MTLSNLFKLLILSASVLASSLFQHESRAAAAPGFIDQGSVPTNDDITLRIALTSQNVSGLQDILTSISTPGDPVFRQWLSADEIKAFVSPSSETLEAFNLFAVANELNATSISPHGDWVSLTLPVSRANTLFGAQYKRFRHPRLTQPVMRTLSISLPSELVGHVEAIYPGTAFFTPSKPPSVGRGLSLKKGTTDPSCNTSDPAGEMTPSCLQSLYDIPSTPSASRRDNRLLVTGYEGRSPSRESLSEFLQDFRPDISRDTGFDLIKIDNANFTSNGSFDIYSFEADLDIQYAVGLAAGVSIQFLSVGGLDDSSLPTGLLDTISFLEAMEDPPSVMSTSYVFSEEDLGFSLTKKLCDGYSALGARGISVLFASGDGGVRGTHDDPTQCNSTAFIPVFPASCPWVTSVGGTQGFNPEIALNLTGGGFSAFFPRPAYQLTAVERFLSTIPEDFVGTFNRAGRGYPDVSLQANNFAFISQGLVGFKLGGTSFSTPVFAAIVALINDRLLSVGKERLGFLNPWLYQNQAAFTDITAGNNPGSMCPASSVAFEAVKGWDALTGLGTPVFGKLFNAALVL
ncbi:subtilisin-like protein [Roridomyces roridus]|uniref:Subtilisin-like protein n=1 Tax=Roridomyces roridus TaxID=1738132 RepID=A0AAD7B1K2_9AGAR|nr:subtilisin-like protein [Roridomyces roridus]KAJ7621496.1 subtilisin-like protein [Roridomyces roridus]